MRRLLPTVSGVRWRRTQMMTLAGHWHLLPVNYTVDQEIAIPQHRVDFVFYDEPAELRGAVVSQVDGSEIPLQTVSLTGVELRLRMSVPPNQPDVELPFLVMRVVGDHFEGGWDLPGTEHIRLKLIPARIVN